MTPSLGIEPGPHWWEASALTTTPPLLPFIFHFNIRVLCSIHFSITYLSTLTLESEVLKEEEQEEKEGESVSEEEEIEISLEDETVEPVEEEEEEEEEEEQEEEEVVLTSEGENDVAAEDENEFLGDFSGTNCESIILYR